MTRKNSDSAQAPKNSDEESTWGTYLKWIGLGCGIPLGILAVVLPIAATILVPKFENTIQNTADAMAHQTLNQAAVTLKSHYQKNETFPAVGKTIKTSPTVPKGGEKIQPNPTGGSAETIQKIGLGEALEGSTYFQYIYTARRTGTGTQEVTIKARADYDPGGDVHTLTLTFKSGEKIPAIETHEEAY